TAPRRLDEDRLRRFVPVVVIKPASRPTAAVLEETATPPAPGPEPVAAPAANLGGHDTTSAFGLRPRSAPLPPRPLTPLMAPLSPPADLQAEPEPVERIDIGISA